MIENILREYVPSILIIIGMIEFIKKIVTLKKTVLIVLHILFSLISAALVVLAGSTGVFEAILIVDIIYRWLLLIAITALFYQLIVKKIRDAGGKVKDN